MFARIHFKGVMVLLFLGTAAMGQSAPRDREAPRTKAGDQELPITQQVAARMLQAVVANQLSAGAHIQIDYTNPNGMGITILDRKGDQLVLDFELNTTSNVLRPVFSEQPVAQLYGRPFFGFVDLLQSHTSQAPGAGRGADQGMRPFDAAAAAQPHDDVSVLILDEDLVMIALWQNNQRLGVYYAVDTDSYLGERRRETGTVAAGGDVEMTTVPPKQAVCNKLLQWCTSDRYDMPTAIACALWLWFCAV